MAISGKFLADFSSFNAEVQKAQAQLGGFEAQAVGAAVAADKIGASSSIATTGVSALATATTALTQSQSLATLSTAELDAMLAGETVAMGTAAAATEAAAVSAGAYGSVIFATAEAEAAATTATAGFTASLATAATTITGLVATIAPWLAALGIAIAYLKEYIEAQGKAAVAAETAAAKQDKINQAMRLGAPAGISYANAIKFVNEQDAHRLALFPEVAYQRYHKELDASTAAAKRLADEQAALEAGAAAHGETVKTDSDIQHQWTEATRLAKEEAKKHEEALKRLEAANQRFRDSVKNLTTDAIGAARGLGIYGALLPDLSENTAQFADQTILLSSALDATKNDVETLQRSGQFLSVAIMKINQELIKLPNVSAAAKDAIKQVNDEAARGHNILTGFADGLKAVWAGMSGGKGIGGLFENLGKGIIEQFGSLITQGITNLINTGLGLLEKGLKRLFGGPSSAEVEGRKTEAQFESQFKSFQDMVESIGKAYVLTGRTAQQAREDVEALLAAERQGPEAVQALIDSLQGALDAAKEIEDAMHAGGARSNEELQHAADVTRKAFEEALKSGNYNQENLDKLYVAYQQALADAGSEAAKAWLKAHDATKTVDADLQKLIDRRDELTKGIAQEAPEAEMGVIEKQMRAERDALDEQIKNAQKGADATANAQTEASQITKERWGDASQVIEDELSKAGDSAADHIKDSFDFTIHIPIVFDSDNPDIPFHKMASGGSGIVTKPTLFLAGEAGPESFAFNRGSTSSAMSGSDPLIAEIRALRAALLSRPTVVSIAGREIVRATHTEYDLNRDGSLTELRQLAGTV